MKKLTPSRVILENSTSVERHIVQGLREPWTSVNGRVIELTFYSGLNVFYAKGMDIDKVRQIAGQSTR
jgi:hypothetical protein